MVEELKSLNKIKEVNRLFPKSNYIDAWKEKGGRVIGWINTYVPEEIIHAAGILPIRIAGGDYIRMAESDAVLSPTICSAVRTSMQMAMEHKFDYLDGFVACTTCDSVRRLYDVWRAYIGTPYSHMITVPTRFSDSSRKYYYDEVMDFKDSIEGHFGVEVTQDALRSSIRLYNHTRRLLKALHELRKAASPPLSGSEFLEVVNAAMRMPREDYNVLLEEIVDECRSGKRKVQGETRLMLSGSMWNNPSFITFIEDQDCLVVTDELCTGTRYFWDPVEVNNNDDSLKSVVDRYLYHWPYPHMVDFEERWRRLVEQIESHNVHGVVSQILRFCVIYAYEQPEVTMRLKEIGIPVLELDVEYGAAISGQVRTRIQAFVEMIQGI